MSGEGASGRFAITPARAVEDHRLGDAAYRVLACLGTYADKDGWCWPSMTTLAVRLGVSRQAAQRSIRQLADLGYIEIRRQRRDNGASDRNRYRLLFDRALFQIQSGAGIGQRHVAGGQPVVAGGQRGRQGEGNVGDTPYIDERTHKNVSTLEADASKAGKPGPGSVQKEVYDLGKRLLGSGALPQRRR